MPWWGVVLMVVVLTAIGALADQSSLGKPGVVFLGCFALGCLLAVVLVERRSVFATMVQPPLLLVIVLSTVALAWDHDTSAGNTARLFAVAAPLVMSFPAMAITTAVVVVVGVLRVVLQRPYPKMSPQARTQPRTHVKIASD
jgi:hypothetical protein